MRARDAIAAAAIGALVVSCSLASLDYLRDPTCAPNCGATPDGGDAAAADDARAPDASAGCATNAGYRALVLCDRPAAYLRLGEAAPPSAFDEVDGGPLGAYASDDGGIGFGAPGAIAGDTDRAVHLDGTGRVSLGDAFRFVGTAPMSIEAWVSPDAVDGLYRRIVERTVIDGQGIRDGYLLVSQSDALTFQRARDHEVIGARSSPLGQGGYSYVVATFDGATSRVYVNGTLQGSADAGVDVPDVASVFLVGNTAGAQGGFVGSIDELAVYPYALTDAQVVAHFRVGRGLE